MDAVEPEEVQPGRVGDRLGGTPGHRLDTAAHEAGNEHRLEAQLPHRVLQSGDRLLGSVHRHHRRRGEPVGDVGERLGVISVERPACRLAELGVLGAQEGHPHRRVDDREVEAELVEARAQQPGEGRRGQVEGVARRERPPRESGAPLPGPLLVGEQVPGQLQAERRARRRGVDRDALGAHVCGQSRPELEGVAVGVDHGMAQPLADLRRRQGSLAQTGHRRRCLRPPPVTGAHRGPAAPAAHRSAPRRRTPPHR